MGDCESLSKTVKPSYIGWNGIFLIVSYLALKTGAG